MQIYERKKMKNPLLSCARHTSGGLLSCARHALVAGQKARALVPFSCHWRHGHLALWCGMWAAWMERAATWRIRGGWKLPLEKNAFHGVLPRAWNSGEKRLCVGVQGILQYIFCLAKLDDMPQIHHRDTMGNQPHNT